MLNRPTTILVAILVGILVLILFGRSYLVMDRKGFRTRIMTPRSVLVSQIPTVFDQLKNQKDGSWAAFAFCPLGEPANANTSVNLQYSVEGGKIGLDWVLLGSRNKADKDKIVTFINGRNHTVLERQRNGVSYLRVEDGDLVELGDQIARVCYHLRNDSDMDIFTDGFNLHL